MHKLLLAALVLAAVPASAQPPAAPLGRALAEIEAHRVGMRVGCSIPMPALWNAPAWEQRAAANRRAAFEDCLSGVMQREQDRLALLQSRIGALRAEAPDSDWSAADRADLGRVRERRRGKGRGGRSNASAVSVSVPNRRSRRRLNRR